MKDSLRTTVNAILAKMIAAGYTDVCDHCNNWSDHEVYDFYCNFVDEYQD